MVLPQMAPNLVLQLWMLGCGVILLVLTPAASLVAVFDKGMALACFVPVAKGFGAR